MKINDHLTSHVMSLPDLVTPIFCVRPRDTCITSVFNMGRRRGVEMPLPQVYTEDKGNGCIIFVDVRPDSPPRRGNGAPENPHADGQTNRAK